MRFLFCITFLSTSLVAMNNHNNNFEYNAKRLISIKNGLDQLANNPSDLLALTDFSLVATGEKDKIDEQHLDQLRNVGLIDQNECNVTSAMKIEYQQLMNPAIQASLQEIVKK